MKERVKSNIDKKLSENYLLTLWFCSNIVFTVKFWQSSNNWNTWRDFSSKVDSIIDINKKFNWELLKKICKRFFKSYRKHWEFREKDLDEVWNKWSLTLPLLWSKSHFIFPTLGSNVPTCTEKFYCKGISLPDLKIFGFVKKKNNSVDIWWLKCKRPENVH